MQSIDSSDSEHEDVESVKLLRRETAFQNRISEYILQNIAHSDPRSFLIDALPIFREETIKLLREHFNIKIHTSFKVEFAKQIVSPDGEISEQKMFHHFNTKACILTHTTNLNVFYSENIVEKTLGKVNDFQLMGSGWTIRAIDSLSVSNCKYQCFNGASYMKLPKFIESKKAIINVQNFDNKCFLWSVLAALHYKEFSKNLHRVSNYKKYENEMNMTNIKYPVTLGQIEVFEKQNVNISVNVYMYECKRNPEIGLQHCIYPIRLTKTVKSNHIHLLLSTDAIDENDGELCDDEDYAEVDESDSQYNETISDGMESKIIRSHYSFIKVLSKLLQSQTAVVNRRKKFFCDRCLNYFYAKEKRNKHSENCIHMNFTKMVLPTQEEKWIEFKNHKYKLEVPFIIYADSEAILPAVKDDDPRNGKDSNDDDDDDDEIYPKGAYQKHIPHSVGYFLYSKHPELLESCYQSYSGLDCMEWFAKQLKKIAVSIFEILDDEMPMRPLTPQQQHDSAHAKMCHICEKCFEKDDVKVIDHSHLTGEYRGISHQSCNLLFQESRIIPVVFHNLKYDLHLLIEEIAAVGTGKVDIIPMTSENYISFTKTFSKHDLSESKKFFEKLDYKKNIKFRFIDSFRFLPESLEKLASNLPKSDLKITKQIWNDLNENEFDLITRKGVYPYDYVDSIGKLNETSLPPIEKFHNELNDSDITQEAYDFAQSVWCTFKIQSMQQYTDIYLKTDVLLLSDIFENFRVTSLSCYGLEPAHYFTLPGYSWDAMLKITKARIELIHGSNIDQLNFFERGNFFWKSIVYKKLTKLKHIIGLFLILTCEQLYAVE